MANNQCLTGEFGSRHSFMLICEDPSLNHVNIPQQADLFSSVLRAVDCRSCEVRFWDRAPSASVPAFASIGRAVPLIADQCPVPLGCQLIKLFGSRPARRCFTTSLARYLPTSATRSRQAAVSAIIAIWSSSSLSNSASVCGILRSLHGSSRAGFELAGRLFPMS